MKETFRDCIVPARATLRDAMRAIDGGAVGIALVVDDSEKLLGTMTDGDIRRALLAGNPLDSELFPHIQRTFTAVSPSDGRAEVVELMQARSVHQVPIVDDQQRVVGLHLMRQMIGANERGNWAVVMAGGKGMRLRPLTDVVPKPMLPIAGRPILERIVLHLVGHGIRKIFFAVRYLRHIIEDHFEDGHRFGCEINYLREDEALGTAGALTLLPQLPDQPLLVMNGDLLTQANVSGMLDLHQAKNYTGLVGVRQYNHEVPFGCVQLEGDRICQIREKPTLRELVNAGIYTLSPELIATIPAHQESPMTTVLEQAIARGDHVGVYEVTGDWIDIGQPSQLKLARNGSAATQPTQEEAAPPASVPLHPIRRAA